MTKTNDEGFIRAAKDITAGSVGGIAQVLTGQPFDIVKVFSNFIFGTLLTKTGSSTNSTILWSKGVYWGN